MNPPLALGSIVIILAIALLTEQESVVGTSKNDASIHGRHPRAIINARRKFPKHKPVAPATPCPNGDLFCDIDPDYPKDIINDLLKRQKPSDLLLSFFHEEKTPKFSSVVAETENSLCFSSRKIMYPQKAKSQEGIFELVVNTDRYRQEVRVEICIDTNKSCDIPGYLSQGYKSSCVQKSIKRTLVVLNATSSSEEGFDTKPFEFPSSCCCDITRFNRFGSPIRFPSNHTKSSGDKKTSKGQ